MTKIPAGLAQYPDVTPTPNLAWTPTKQSWTNYVKDINPAFLESVNISVLGQSDGQKEPAKTMNAWWSTNRKTLDDNKISGD
jgi:hypothetical protein